MSEQEIAVAVFATIGLLCIVVMIAGFMKGPHVQREDWIGTIAFITVILLFSLANTGGVSETYAILGNVVGAFVIFLVLLPYSGLLYERYHMRRSIRETRITMPAFRDMEAAKAVKGRTKAFKAARAFNLKLISEYPTPGTVESRVREIEGRR